MKRLVTLDSTIVVILAGGKAQGHPYAQQRAIETVEHHENSGDQIAITAPALAECCHLDEPIISKLKIINFNAAAATLANELAPEVRTEGKRARRKVKPTRQEVTIDAFILAAAEAAKVDIIYTIDPWFKKAALRRRLRIDVRTLPDLQPVQLEIKETDPSEPEPPSEQSPGGAQE